MLTSLVSQLITTVIYLLGTAGWLDPAGTSNPPLRGPLGFLSTPNTKSLKLTGTYTSFTAASGGTFLLVLLLTFRAGNHIGDPPPMVDCDSGRFWCTLFHSLSLRRVGGAE
jgi:hypothetical protein